MTDDHEEDEDEEEDDLVPMCFVDKEFRLRYRGLLVLRITPHPHSITYNNNYHDDDEIA